MAETTAGIGEAGALINTARPQMDNPITRGLQLAEQDALRKAQMDAAAAEKEQKRLQYISGMIDKSQHRFKEAKYARQAEDLIKNTINKLSGLDQFDVASSNQIRADYHSKISEMLIKDATLHALNPRNYNKDKSNIDITPWYEAAKSDKLPDFIESQPWYARDIVDVDDNGDLTIKPVKKVDLSKDIPTVIRSVNPDITKVSPKSGLIEITTSLSQGDIDNAAKHLLDNPTYNSNIVYDKGFQGFVSKRYPNIQTEEELEFAKFNYAKNKVYEYSEEKRRYMNAPKGDKGKIVDSYLVTNDGFNVGKYQFNYLERPAQDYVTLLEDANVSVQTKGRYGYDFDRQVMIDNLKKMGGSVQEVVLPENRAGQLTFNATSYGIDNAKVDTIFNVGGKNYITYKVDKITYVKPLDEGLFKSLASFYDTTPQNLQKALQDMGMNVNLKQEKQAPPSGKSVRNNLTGGPNSAPPTNAHSR